MIYAGIGSRETPSNVLGDMADFAHYVARMGYILRSGAAPGADSAFERGCDQANGAKEIYIPWNGFSNRYLTDRGVITFNDPRSEKIAAQFHPNWGACSHGARALHSRNVAQILGENLDTPADFVVCWTKGATGAGGTGQALRIARHFNIPIFDLGDMAAYARLNAFIPE